MAPRSALDRREFLKSAAAGLALASVPASGQGTSSAASPLAAEVTRFLATLRQPDNGFGWGDQPRSHLTPTYGTVGSYHLLGLTPDNPAAVAEYIRTHHPFTLKKLEREMKAFEFQQIQSLLWLGADASFLKEHIAGWTKPFAYTKRYEDHGYPVFEYETIDFIGRQLLGMPLDDLSPEMLAYLDSRRRANGSFNNTPADDGTDGHIGNTWWGLRALATLGREQERRAETIAWVQACQRSTGGFTWQPQPYIAPVEDVYYIWAALRILELLGARPSNPAGALDWLAQLWNDDGGFAARPGWDSNPIATYYALDSLRVLAGFDKVARPRSRAKSAKQTFDDGWNVYTIQVEAHGQGSPVEAVDLARGLHIHLWAAKNPQPGWLEATQAIADRDHVPVKFCYAAEEYGTLVTLPGFGTYSHTADLMAESLDTIGPSLARAGVVDWETFRQKRLGPLEAGGGRLLWQFNENEAMTRLYLDDSLLRRGYSAISTFHFGNPDFTNSSPFLKLYRNQIPYIGQHDAHGAESWWWGDMLTGYRTLFVAREPTWAAWLDALQHNRVASVRHDAVSRGETWMHGGPPEVTEFIRSRESQWTWWENPEIERPLVSLVAITPETKLEAGRPERGIALRVRCQWENTAAGEPKTQRVELVKLLVDGREVDAPAQAIRGRDRKVLDQYHLYAWPDAPAGPHTATAVVRVLDTGRTAERMIRFTV